LFNWKRGLEAPDPNSGAPVVLKVDRVLEVIHDRQANLPSWGIVAETIQGFVTYDTVSQGDVPASE